MSSWPVQQLAGGELDTLNANPFHHFATTDNKLREEYRTLQPGATCVLNPSCLVGVRYHYSALRSRTVGPVLVPSCLVLQCSMGFRDISIVDKHSAVRQRSRVRRLPELEAGHGFVGGRCLRLLQYVWRGSGVVVVVVVGSGGVQPAGLLYGTS